MGKHVGERAVVLGASMAGLFAARVLSESYAQVAVVDRDRLTGVEGPRRGVPQGRQIHGLQAAGLRAIEEMFPGLTQELVTAGASIGDMAGNIRLFLNGSRMRNPRSGLSTLAVSRPFLERHVRTAVQALPNVTFLEEHDILGLRAAPENRRITGARVRPHGGEGEEQVLDADLVVDATGRGTRTPLWLEELGYQRVEEERKKIGLGYATQVYRMLSDPFEKDEFEIVVVSSPATPRGAIAMKIEGGRVMVTAYGILGDHPPTDPAGFLGFVKSLQVPDIHEAIAHLEPLDEPIGYRFPVNLRRRYEDLPALPDGLLVTGDAVCSFNPAYAQGMSVAALGALTLRRRLRRGGAPEPLAFQRELARRVVDGSWEMMTSADLSFPGVEGVRTLKTRVGHALMGRLQAAATRDDRVATAYVRVIGLIDPVSELMRPGMLLRIVWSSRRGPARPAVARDGGRPVREAA